MVYDKISVLREKLNNLVKKNATFEEIYKVSREIDEYVVEYYDEMK